MITGVLIICKVVIHVNPLLNSFNPSNHHMLECNNSTLVRGDIWYKPLTYLPCFANVAPNLGSRESLVLFVCKPIQGYPPTTSSLRIELYQPIPKYALKVRFPNSIALTIHLHMRLILVASGFINPKSLYFFFMQHSYQLTLVWVSYSFPYHM